MTRYHPRHHHSGPNSYTQQHYFAYITEAAYASTFAQAGDIQADLQTLEPILKANTELLITLHSLGEHHMPTLVHALGLYRVFRAMCAENDYLRSLPEETLGQSFLAAVFHDIGKLNVDETILNSPGRELKADQLSIVQKHPKEGYDIFSRINPHTEFSALLILGHHILQTEPYKPYPVATFYEHFDKTIGNNATLAKQFYMVLAGIVFADHIDARLGVTRPYNAQDNPTPQSVVVHTLDSITESEHWPVTDPEFVYSIASSGLVVAHSILYDTNGEPIIHEPSDC